MDLSAARNASAIDLSVCVFLFEELLPTAGVLLEELLLTAAVVPVVSVETLPVIRSTAAT